MHSPAKASYCFKVSSMVGRCAIFARGMNGGEDTVWRLRGRLARVRFPLVMGILNSTPDSFYAGSRQAGLDGALHAAEAMLEEGAAMIDVGGASTRPGAAEVPEEEERRRTVPLVDALHRRFPEAWISIDTWRGPIAREAVQAGAVLVNDIGAGLMDPVMLETVAALHVPYILMHMQGRPVTMQNAPHYVDVVADVVRFLSERALAAHRAGIADLVVDPGFGFGKDKGHNFTLLRNLDRVRNLGFPILAGVSRKRMINEVLGTGPDQALNGSTVLNTVALLNGASILRAHDVKEAVQAVKLVQALRDQGPCAR